MTGGYGGIFNGGTLTLMNSTVWNNATRGQGGGILNGSIFGPQRGTLTLINSTVFENRATGPGAGDGIHQYYGTTTLINSTVSGNAIDIGGDTGLTLINSTVSGSYTQIFLGSGASVTMTNTVVDGGCHTVGDVNTTSNGYNIESPGDTCGFDQEGDQASVTAEQLNLGPLDDNGGPTMTHALLTDPVVSAAIDQIPADVCEVDTDQRGQPRPETGGDACDVGAFELQP